MDCQSIKVLVIGIGLALIIALGEGYYISRTLIDKEPLLPAVSSKSVLSDGVKLHAKEFSSNQKLVLRKAVGY